MPSARNPRAVLPRRARSSRVAHNGPAVHRTSPHRRPSVSARAQQMGPSSLPNPPDTPTLLLQHCRARGALRPAEIDVLFLRAKAAGARVFAERSSRIRSLRGKLAASFEKVSCARVRVESRSKDDNFDHADDLRSRNGVAPVRSYCTMPDDPFNAGLTHPPQRVRSSRS